MLPRQKPLIPIQRWYYLNDLLLEVPFMHPPAFISYVNRNKTWDSLATFSIIISLETGCVLVHPCLAENCHGYIPVLTAALNIVSSKTVFHGSIFANATPYLSAHTKIP